MIELQRLTLDSSWYLHWQNLRLIVDPWLIGPEVDGFSWLNKQWHTTSPVAIPDLPPYDFILLSQSYEDHCHLRTLQALPTKVPLLATGKAYDKVRRHFRDRQIYRIPELGKGQVLELAGYRFRAIHPGKWLDPVYFAVVISDREGRTIFYAPHGFQLNERQLAELQDESIGLLFTTFTDFRLPAIMGGQVNPGFPHAVWLQKMLRPRYIVNTHDEEKQMQGLVNRLARVRYPDPGEARSVFGDTFLEIPDYRKRDIHL